MIIDIIDIKILNKKKPFKVNAKTHQNIIGHEQLDFIPEMQRRFNIRKSVNAIHL